MTDDRRPYRSGRWTSHWTLASNSNELQLHEYMVGTLAAMLWEYGSLHTLDFPIPKHSRHGMCCRLR